MRGETGIDQGPTTSHRDEPSVGPADPIWARVTYFGAEDRGVQVEEVARGVVVKHLVDATSQFSALVDAAGQFDWYASETSRSAGVRHVTPPFAPASEQEDFQVVSVQMKSPFTVLLAIPARKASGFGLGLLLLAERICTFRPRVSRKRKEEVLRGELLDLAKRQVLDGYADALATQILGNLDVGRLAPGPSRVDLLDPSGDDDLEEFVGWGQ